MRGSKLARYVVVFGLLVGIVVVSAAMYRPMIAGHNVEGTETEVTTVSKVTGGESKKAGDTLPVHRAESPIQSIQVAQKPAHEALAGSPAAGANEREWKDWVDGTPYLVKMYTDMENASGGAYTTADVMQLIIDGKHVHRFALHAMCPRCYEAVVLYEQTSLGEVMSDDAMQAFLKSDDFVYLYEYLNNNTRHSLHNIRHVGYKSDQDNG